MILGGIKMTQIKDVVAKFKRDFVTSDELFRDFWWLLNKHPREDIKVYLHELRQIRILNLTHNLKYSGLFDDSYSYLEYKTINKIGKTIKICRDNSSIGLFRETIMQVPTSNISTYRYNIEIMNVLDKFVENKKVDLVQKAYELLKHLSKEDFYKSLDRIKELRC